MLVLFTHTHLAAQAPPAASKQTSDQLNAFLKRKQILVKKFKALKLPEGKQEQLLTLRDIVDLHRKAFEAATTLQDKPLVEKIRQGLVSDGKLYSNRLIDAEKYDEAATMLKELEKLLANTLGNEAAATLEMRWDATGAERLAKASKDQQTGFAQTEDDRSKALEAIKQGQLATAERTFVRIVTVSEAVLGVHPKVADDLNQLGRIQMQMEKFAQAEKTFQRALVLRKTSIGKDLSYATMLFNLGLAYQKQERLADAEKQFLVAAEIEERILGRSNQAFIQTLQQIASLYAANGDSGKLKAIEQRMAAGDPFNIVLEYMPQDTLAAVAASPKAMTMNTRLQTMPFELIQSFGLQEFGVDPLSMEAVVGFVVVDNPSAPKPPLQRGVIFRLRDNAPANFAWLKRMQEEKRGDRTVFKEPGSSPESLCSIELEDRVFFFGTEGALNKVLSREGRSRVAGMIRSDRQKGQIISAADIAAMRPLLKLALQESPRLPPPLEALKQLPPDTDNIRLSLDLSIGLGVMLSLFANDEQAANKSLAAIAEAIDFGFEILQENVLSGLSRSVDVPTQKYAQRMTNRMRGQIQPRVRANHVLIQTNLVEGAFAPAAVAMLLPAIQSARGAAKKTIEANNLKLIGLALHNDHLVRRTFIPASGLRGNLSWRVHLLPYLDHADLYGQFKLDEPWDSPHNKTLIPQMPDLFRVQGAEPGTTSIHVLLGPGTLFGDGTVARSLSDITDGSSNTILAVQAGPNVAETWTKPGGLRVTSATTISALGNIGDQFQVLRADGSVYQEEKRADSRELFKAFTHAGGEVRSPGQR